jgi:hypothetical protein
VLDAIEMARWNRGLHHSGLRCHSDAGSQGGFKWSSQHLTLRGWWHGNVTAAAGDLGDAWESGLAGAAIGRTA